MKPERDRSSGRVVVFPDWEEELAADRSLTPVLREAYRQAVRGFLAFCQQRGSGATVALAREHVEAEQVLWASAGGEFLGVGFLCGALGASFSVPTSRVIGRQEAG